MKQSKIIKKIHMAFKKFNGNVNFDSSTNKYRLKNHISLKYIASKYFKETIGTETSNGTLRIFHYSKNPTKTYELMDDVEEFLHDKVIDGLEYNISMHIQSPNLDSNGKLYEAVVDYSVKIRECKTII
ncbi:MAG TPA: hypothetical protein EYG89_06375 [Bacteroidia bacterium]|nr:hypothetical protein [Bacteroidia bacterium]